MTPRRYPDEPSGEFPEPPRTVTDREDREIRLVGYRQGEDLPDPLVAMYDDFDPADRAQGIPPSGEDQIRRWLEDLFETGYNVVAWHDDRVAGHATLVPEETDPGREETDPNQGNPDSDHGETHSGETDPVPEGQPPHELAIFVLQAYQGAGIGKHLLRTLLGFGAAQGVDRVWLTVEQWNRAAINLYQDVGFETVDARSFEQEMAIRTG